jgi:type I restriction-modification system DNA methylase subunit
MLTLSQLEQQLSKEIFMAYKEYKDIPGFAKVVTNEKILENGATLNISQYVSRLEVKDEMPKQSLEELLNAWERNREKLYTEIKNLI